MQLTMESHFTPVVTSPTAVCDGCSKSQGDMGDLLKRCGTCKMVLYCSRECQIGHWPVHKAACRKLEMTTTTTSAAPRRLNPLAAPFYPALPESQTDTEFLDDDEHDALVSYIMSLLHGDLGSSAPNDIPDSYLSELPRKMVFRQLIDAYRLRIEDDYLGGGGWSGPMEDEDPHDNFRDYLDEAEESGVLPGWWNKGARKACMRLANNQNGGCCIYRALEASDIHSLYPDDMFMPMKLRALAEKIYGSGAGMW